MKVGTGRKQIGRASSKLRSCEYGPAYFFNMILLCVCVYIYTHTY